MKLTEAIELFKKRCIMMNLSKTTCNNYFYSLKMLLEWSGDILLGEINKQFVLEYCFHVVGRNIKAYSARSYLIDFRTFLNYLWREGYTENWGKYVIIPKTEPREIIIYTDEEIDRMFKSFDSSGVPIRERNYCIVALLYDCGMRAQEVCNLTRNDVDFKKKIIKVYGKGRKYRFVPLGNLSYQLLQKYLSLVPVSEHLLLTESGEPITYDTIKCLFYRLRRNTGISVSAHKLRHNFATNFLVDQYNRKGHADIYQLQILMGHSSVETTMVYLHIAQQIIACQSSNSHLDGIHLSI